MSNRPKIIGETVSKDDEFGLWTVIQYVGKHRNRPGCWLCECKCGKQTIIPGDRLLAGTASTGCKKCRKRKPSTVGDGDGTRTCKTCGEVKPIENFYLVRAQPGNRKRSCRECESKVVAEWRRKNPKASRKVALDSYHRRKHLPEMKEKARKARLKTYGLTLEQFDAMVESQSGLCAICGNPESAIEKRTGAVKRLSVDHDHATGKVRALLCGRCNTAVGFVAENPETATRLLAYLHSHKG